MSNVFDELVTLRAQLEAVTRERDSWRSQRDEVHAEMERQTQLKREERQAKLDAMRERDEAIERAHRSGLLFDDARKQTTEARAEAARLREALELAVREMERASNVGEVRFKTNALASGVHIGLSEALFAARAALASAPSAEPTPRDMRVAEAVREACVETADASDEASRRVAGDLRDLDIAAVVAKAVKP